MELTRELRRGRSKIEGALFVSFRERREGRARSRRDDTPTIVEGRNRLPEELRHKLLVMSFEAHLQRETEADMFPPNL